MEKSWADLKVVLRWVAEGGQNLQGFNSHKNAGDDPEHIMDHQLILLDKNPT